MSSSSNHIWKECAGPVLGYWRCGISYGWKLMTCDSGYRNLAPPFASVPDAAGTLPGPRRAANRMEVTWINCGTRYKPAVNMTVKNRFYLPFSGEVFVFKNVVTWTKFGTVCLMLTHHYETQLRANISIHLSINYLSIGSFIKISIVAQMHGNQIICISSAECPRNNYGKRTLTYRSSHMYSRGQK